MHPMPRVAVIIDTSASVPEHLLGQAWMEVHGCLRSLLPVYAADVHVHRLHGVPRKQTARMGGGGTGMSVVLAGLGGAELDHIGAGARTARRPLAFCQ
jgi:predicted metal-dependent peptidase